MNELSTELTPAGEVSRRFLPLLVVLFAGSGCAALIYEIVWFQMLELVIGSSAISLGLLLGTFMGGMCLGSLMMPRFIGREYHPLRVYALMELGIGAVGVAVLLGMPLVSSIYTAWAGSTVAGVVLRGMVAAACLLPPTLLMGATLPAISRWVETTPRGVAWLGFFYGGNIAGAVVGSLLAGFYLLRLYDVTVATIAALALNISVAALSLALSRVTSYQSSDEAGDGLGDEAASEPGGGHPSNELANDAAPHLPNQPKDMARARHSDVYMVIALSGMTALAAEVIWTRTLSLLFGATVYAFAMILAVFLLGLGIGSGIGSELARTARRPRLALALCQLLLCAAMAWAAHALTGSLPYWHTSATMAANPWLKMQFDLLRSVWAVLPAAVLWGASFPLALASVASPGQDPGRLVGRVYAANTLGAILGSLSASLLLVAWIGSRHSEQLLIVLSAFSGLLLLLPLLTPAPSGKFTLWPLTVSSLATIALGLLLWSVPPIPPALVAYGRDMLDSGVDADIFYVGEGLTASVAVSRLYNGTLEYHNAGKVQASSDPADMRLQRMLGHLTTLIPANPRKFLVIGCGAGVTAGAVSIEPKLESETIAEIEPLVPKVVSKYFSQYNFGVIGNPKVHIQIDDGRHFLQTTREKFDGITSDPLDPWVKGAAALYTQEFFELAKDHLTPGGVVTQFVQLYESNEEAVKSEIATFFAVFPHGVLFANTVRGEGYDLVMLGQAEPTRIDVDALTVRLNSPQYAAVAQSLRDTNFYSAVDLLGTFIGRASDLRPWLKGAAINRDSNMRLEYLAGLGLNLYQQNSIYLKMISYGPSLPPDVFTGSEKSLRVLANTIEGRTNPAEQDEQ